MYPSSLETPHIPGDAPNLRRSYPRSKPGMPRNFFPLRAKAHLKSLAVSPYCGDSPGPLVRLEGLGVETVEGEGRTP